MARVTPVHRTVGVKEPGAFWEVSLVFNAFWLVHLLGPWTKIKSKPNTGTNTAPFSTRPAPGEWGHLVLPGIHELTCFDLP